MAGDADQQQIDATGVTGLDDILGGGFTPHRLYSVEGVPGSGKTTLAMQFLMDGARRQEPVLYITLSETKEELLATAASHGWTLDGITVFETRAVGIEPGRRRAVHDVPSVGG
jgi:circadian clock protein KaiC